MEKKGPFDPNIPSPSQFLGYDIGSQHTRHDRIVAYFEHLANISDKAEIEQYGMTYEHRPLVILRISSPENLQQIAAHQQRHLALCDPSQSASDMADLPVFVNLGYNVHGNEPSSSEAAMLAAYTYVASRESGIQTDLQKSIIFIDPTINPDGRDRHSHWANMYKAQNLVSDPQDAEHNEGWPRGRTNHYWFDLNRDWILGVHPESQGKLKWYHQWYPNVVTDFHEMGTNSTYFFEPMKDNGSLNPIMPKENYTTLNDLFARYFREAMDEIGSFYFTKEVFDGTYPGYGSSYPDLQGGLGILFEQASSRGHLQETPTGPISFAFTIRNQYINSLATVRAATDNKDLLHNYQQAFFQSAINNARNSDIQAYVFGDAYDQSRRKAFVDLLLMHGVEVYELSQEITVDGISYHPDWAYVVPTTQPQYRMVQTMFETYDAYFDSVFYDASAWSIANFYHMQYSALGRNTTQGPRINSTANPPENNAPATVISPSDYAYIISWDDYYSPALLHNLQAHGAVVSAAFKPFSIPIDGQEKQFGYGTLVVPVRSRQKISPDSLFKLVNRSLEKYPIEAYAVPSGYSSAGIDLGSRYIAALEAPKALLLIGDGVSSYEAGEVWHVLDQRIGMPLTKVWVNRFSRLDLAAYNTMIMVSGSYAQLDSVQRKKIQAWVRAGNTLITIRQASEWAIKQKLVKEKLIVKEKTAAQVPVKREAYGQAPEQLGKKQVGGAIFEVSLDLTHPLAFGYHNEYIPVYRNSNVWLAPSQNAYSTVAKYTADPHVDGFIDPEVLEKKLKPSASLIVSSMGRGRVVLFADNPNFRGAWYGTNRLFFNALFLGHQIRVPAPRSHHE